MRERDVELALKHAAERAGGVCWKWESRGFGGVPDRLVVLPVDACRSGTHIFAVEVKAPGKRPTKLQEHRHKTLRALGMKVYVIDTIEGAEALIADKMTHWTEALASG